MNYFGIVALCTLVSLVTWVPAVGLWAYTVVERRKRSREWWRQA